MADSEKVCPDPPPYTQQPSPQPQSGYPGQPQPGYQPEPGYPAQPGQQPQPGQELQPVHTAQPGYPPPQPVQQVQQSTTMVNVGMPATQTIIVPSNPRPQNYIGLSICTFLFCCLPIGLAAIVFSRRVDSSYDAGDYDGALRNSNIAARLNLASILCGIVLVIILTARNVQ